MSQKQSMWVHGFNVVSQLQSTDALQQVQAGGNGMKNSDVIGYNDSAVVAPNLSQSPGKWFQGKAGVINAFLCAVPTPTTMNSVQPSLQDVMVLYSADPSVQLTAFLADGPNILGTYNNAIVTSRGNIVTGGPGDLIEGTTAFTAGNFVNPATGATLAGQQFDWGMVIILTFQFTQDGGRVFFTSVGADWETP